MNPLSRLCPRAAALLLAVAAATAHAQLRLPGAAPGAAAAPSLSGAAAATPRVADYIVAIVNQELVTHAEVELRVSQVRFEAQRRGQSAPDSAELRRATVEQLIDERAQLSLARETIGRVDESEVDQAVATIAAQNRLTVAQLRERLVAEGQDFGRLRANLHDQLLLERLRERELQQRLAVSEAELDDYLDRQRNEARAGAPINIAQLLVAVPERAGAEQLQALQRRAETALARARAGEDFAALVRELSDGERAEGGALGLREPDRLPDLFVAAVNPLEPGSVAPALVRSGAGFHVLKLLERRDSSAMTMQQHARHILLPIDARLTREQALARLAGYRAEVLAGKAKFEDLARQHSADGSAAQGGDLGWTTPGVFVAEFQQALDGLEPGEIAEPIVSRFGAHLVQLLERRDVPLDARARREQARAVLRERKSDAAYRDWAREVRERAYVEMREPPQ